MRAWRRDRLDPAQPWDSLGAAGVADRPTLAVAERTRLLNQFQALNTTAPVLLRERIGEGTGKQLERRVLSMRARANADMEERIVFGVMRDLAARSRALAADAKRSEQQLAALVRSLDRTLLDEPRDWTDLSREAVRLRPLSLQARDSLRSVQWDRATASLLGQDSPTPAQPRR